jgi:hypothetical protein
MNIELKQKTDLMVENFHELKGNFKWGTELLKHFAAMVHATKGKMVDVNKLQEMKKQIKDETSWTSYFRGANQFIITTLLSFEEDYKSFFKDMLSVYEKLKSAGFKNSPYLPLASYTLVKDVSRDQWELKIQRMKEFFNKMKKNHFWLTSSDDYVFAAVLAATDLDVEETVQKIENCYNFLNQERFYKGNDLQTLSHILAIGEGGELENCRKAVRLYNRLADERCKLQYSGLASLGVLTLVASDVDKIVSDIREVHDYIYGQDGYGYWKLAKSMRIILASTIVSDYYVDEVKKGVIQIALGNSINAIIIAQQQAAVAAACAASSAAAASSSS